MPAHSSLKSLEVSSEPPNAPFDLCCKPKTAALPKPIMRTIETSQMGSIGKLPSSSNFSVSGPAVFAAELTAKVILFSSN